MRLTNRRVSRERKMELSMTSMIDVVFLLLIFFMTSSRFIQAERNLASDIRDGRARSQAESDLEPAIVDVMRSDGRTVFRIGTRDVTSREELTSVLRQFPNKLDGAYVRVDRSVPFASAAAAVQACKDAGFIAVAYVPKE